jgi:hypothetical protein
LMTASKRSVKLLIGPLITCMREGGDPWAVNLAYWNTRRELMQRAKCSMVPQRTRAATSTPPWTSFSPAPDRGDHQIDEAQLRKELGAAIGGFASWDI